VQWSLLSEDFHAHVRIAGLKDVLTLLQQLQIRPAKTDRDMIQAAGETIIVALNTIIAVKYDGLLIPPTITPSYPCTLLVPCLRLHGTMSYRALSLLISHFSPFSSITVLLLPDSGILHVGVTDVQKMQRIDAPKGYPTAFSERSSTGCVSASRTTISFTMRSLPPSSHTGEHTVSRHGDPWSARRKCGARSSLTSS